MLTVTPASRACSAKSVAASTKPGTMSEVCSVTSRFSWPASASSERACSRSCSGLRERNLAHHVDLAAEERVQARRVVVDGDVLPLVDVRLALVPVVLVADAETALTGGELGQLERARPDGQAGRLRAVLDDDGVL